MSAKNLPVMDKKDLKPCVICGGKILPMFYQVEIKQVNQNTHREGLTERSMTGQVCQQCVVDGVSLVKCALFFVAMEEPNYGQA
jgi:hypothetical protein